MFSPACSRCHRIIPAEDVNVARDVAYCRVCNLVTPLSSLLPKSEEEPEYEVSLDAPPSGAWYQSSPLRTVIGATHRSLGTAAGLLGIALFWNGITSVFVALALAGTFQLLHVPLPDWFPNPKMNGGAMNKGMVTFLWLFLSPFILIGLGMIWAFLSCLAGRTEVQIKDQNGVVFTGIGQLGRRRRFEVANVKSVELVDRSWASNNGNAQRRVNIVLETRTGKRIEFGSMLTDERRVFVCQAVRKTLKC